MALPRFCTATLGEEVIEGLAHKWVEQKIQEGSVHLVRVEDINTGVVHDLPISAITLKELHPDDFR